MLMPFCVEIALWCAVHVTCQEYYKQSQSYFVVLLNTLRLRQNGHHFPDDIFKCIFLNENVWILIEISLKFVPKGAIANIPALVWIMAWRLPGNKPLSEPMMIRLLMHICVTRPQWVKLHWHWHNGSIPCLLMPWLLKSPGHQQAWYCLSCNCMYHCPVPGKQHWVWLPQCQWNKTEALWEMHHRNILRKKNTLKSLI